MAARWRLSLSLSAPTFVLLGIRRECDCLLSFSPSSSAFQSARRSRIRLPEIAASERATKDAQWRDMLGDLGPALLDRQTAAASERASLRSP
jgi:hypothetical protein